MKISPFWAAIALLVPQAIATTSATSTATSTASASTCTASLITRLCDYPEPQLGTAVASDGKPNCWDYCNAHPPCSFVIFRANNPYLGDGTCWLYPGQSFDESKGSSDCGNPILYVFDQPVCSESPTATTATATTSVCTATRTPSAVASVCGYPAPEEDCFYDCYASSGASNCLDICANKADSCSYAIFNPHNEGNSQYYDGTCWVYPNGTYNADDTTTCKDDPEQYVYENPCPKPSSSSSKGSSSGSDSSSGSATASSATETGAVSAAAEKAAAASASTTKNAAVGLSVPKPAIGMAGLMLLAL